MARLARRDDLTYGYDRDLALRLKRGDLVRFADDDERRRVLALAQEFAAFAAAKASARRGVTLTAPVIEFGSAPAAQKTALVDPLVRGVYSSSSSQEPGKGNTARVHMNLKKNETYSATPGKDFMGLLRRLLPGK
jgi:hypothetical protein